MDATLEGYRAPAAEHAMGERISDIPAECGTGVGGIDESADMGGFDPETSAEETKELTFEEKVELLQANVLNNPRFREIKYRVLGLCEEMRPLRELESLIAEMPEFKACGQNQYRILIYLEDAGGLERFEIDEEGVVVTEEMTDGLTEDEIDDLVADYAFRTTEAGRAVHEKLQPQKRMADLMKIMPARTATYRELLEFCRQPRAFKEIDALLQGRDILKAGSLNPMTNIPLQPSVFVDNLERCGGIVWDGAWKLTEGGRKYLEVLTSMTG